MGVKEDGAVDTANYTVQDVLEREKPNPWAPGLIKLYGCLFFVFWASAMNGYDGTLIGTVYSFPQFQNYWQLGQESTGMSTMVVIYNLGSWSAAFFAGPLSDTWGRKVGLAIGAVITIIGTALMSAATNLATILAGRYFAGFGVVIASSAAPSYVVEICHPAYRGTIGGMYNTLWFFGNIIASWVGYFALSIEGESSWRTPFWTQLIPALIIIVGLPFIPESPRWLIAHGKAEQAREILVKYHGNGNPDSEIVALQYNEMTANITTSGSDQRFWDYSELFKTSNARWRFLMMVFISFFGQQSGSNIFSYFAPTVLEGAGITDKKTILLINACLTIIQFLAAILIGARLTDIIGRRKLVIGGTLTFPIWLSILAACTALSGTKENPNVTVGYIAIVAMYGFQITNAIAWTPMQALYPVECLNNSTRAKGMGMSGLVVYAALAINGYAAPLGLKAMGWTYYLIYIFWDLIECALMYMYLVETKGFTMEELEEIFDAPLPSKASLERRKEIEARERSSA